MSFTFVSKALDRTVSMEETGELELQAAQALYSELVMAVQSLDDSIQETQEQQRLSGILSDKDWVHRVKKKRRICVAFAAQLRPRLEQSTSTTGHQLAYWRTFEQLAREELGEDIYAEVVAEAKQTVLADAAVSYSSL